MSESILTIAWTRPTLKRFKRALSKHLQSKSDPKPSYFTFEGHDFVAGYAKYLIEYLETRLK